MVRYALARPGQVPEPSGSQDAWNIFAIAIDMWYEGKEKLLLGHSDRSRERKMHSKFNLQFLANFPIRISVGKVSLLSLIRLCFISANACGATDQSNFQLYLNPKTFWTRLQLVVAVEPNVHKFATAIWPGYLQQDAEEEEAEVATSCCQFMFVSRGLFSSLFEGRNSPRSAAFRAGCQQFRVGVECLIMGVIMCHWYTSRAWQTRERERERERNRGKIMLKVRHSRGKPVKWHLATSWIMAKIVKKKKSGRENWKRLN